MEGNEEIFSRVMTDKELPGIRRPSAIGLKGEEVQQVISIGE